MSIIYAVAVGIALHLLLQYTVVGRSFYVLGSNPRAAIVAGWPRRRLLALAYILSALLTAVGALILTARAASGAPNLGGGLSLQTIAAAVIGGVSLTGGRGGLVSVCLGRAVRPARGGLAARARGRAADRAHFRRRA